METTIGSWGNSEAVRLPQALLRLTSLRKGDRVSIDVNARGNIEIAPLAPEHRRAVPKRGVSFATLFRGYDCGEAPFAGSGAWPDDAMLGAEWDAWAR